MVLVAASWSTDADADGFLVRGGRMGEYWEAYVNSMRMDEAEVFTVDNRGETSMETWKVDCGAKSARQGKKRHRIPKNPSSDFDFFLQALHQGVCEGRFEEVDYKRPDLKGEFQVANLSARIEGAENPSRLTNTLTVFAWKEAYESRRKAIVACGDGTSTVYWPDRKKLIEMWSLREDRELTDLERQSRALWAAICYEPEARAALAELGGVVATGNAKPQPVDGGEASTVASEAPAEEEMANAPDERVWDFVDGKLYYGTPHTDDIIASFECVRRGRVKAEIPLAGTGGTLFGNEWTVDLNIETKDGTKRHTLRGRKVLIDTRDFNDAYYHTGVFEFGVNDAFLEDMYLGTRITNPAMEGSGIPLTHVSHVLMRFQQHCAR
mgnify:CR=1 FL=1|jgi:hypothetical protein